MASSVINRGCVSNSTKWNKQKTKRFPLVNNIFTNIAQQHNSFLIVKPKHILMWKKGSTTRGSVWCFLTPSNIVHFGWMLASILWIIKIWYKVYHSQISFHNSTHDKRTILEIHKYFQKILFSGGSGFLCSTICSWDLSMWHAEVCSYSLGYIILYDAASFAHF